MSFRLTPERPSEVEVPRGVLRHVASSKPHPGFRSQMVHAGWMCKKGASPLAGWKKRWFVLLANKELHYFTEESCTNRRGIIYLHDVKEADFKPPMVDSSDFHSFQISTPGREWTLGVGSREAYVDWISKLLIIACEESSRSRRVTITTGCDDIVVVKHRSLRDRVCEASPTSSTSSASSSSSWA